MSHFRWRVAPITPHPIGERSSPMLAKGPEDPREVRVDDKPESDRKRKDREKKRNCDVDDALDHTLEQTFPASDPPSTVPGPCDDHEHEEDESDAA
jgi:hypothetical protein